MIDLGRLAEVFGRPLPPDPWEVAREAREERAAILEFDAGMTREAAEAAALRLHPYPKGASYE